MYTKREFPDADRYDVAQFAQDQKNLVENYYSAGGEQQDYVFALKNAEKPVTMYMDDLSVPRSIGARSINDLPVVDFATGSEYKIVPGTRIQNVETFAGKGTKTLYRNAQKYADKYGGEADDWQHVKGTATLRTEDGDRVAEIHWSQAENIGKFEPFVKRWIED